MLYLIVWALSEPSKFSYIENETDETEDEAA